MYGAHSDFSETFAYISEDQMHPESKGARDLHSLLHFTPHVPTSKRFMQYLIPCFSLVKFSTINSVHRI